MKALRLVLLAMLSGAAAAAGPPADLARWTGLWNLGDTLRREGPGAPGPLRPEAQRLLQQVIADQVPVNPKGWCGGLGFAGENGGLVDNVEVLAGAGHLVIIGELGLVRRIITDGRRIPADWPDTREGLSIGRWEEDGTLVVETTHLSENVLYGLMSGGIVKIGRGVRIDERLRLIDDEHLRIESTIEAPELLTAPYRRVRTFTRTAAGYVPRQWDTCWAEDRAIDPRSGKQRFDLSPPADLPPPPPMSMTR